MSGKSVSFGDKKVKKCDFYKTKKLFKTDVNKILVSKKEPYDTKTSFKYFIERNDNDVTRPLCIRLPQMIGYFKCFDSNKTMPFKISDKELLKKYTKIWKKIRSLMNIKFDTEPFYGDYDKYIKTKIRLYGDKVNTNPKRKCIIQMFVTDNARLCCHSK